MQARENKVVFHPGREAPEYIQGELQPMYQAEIPVFNYDHNVLVDEDKNLQLCQWQAGGTPPVKLERV